MGKMIGTGKLVGCHSGKPASDWIGSSSLFQSGSQHTIVIPNEISQMGPASIAKKTNNIPKKNPLCISFFKLKIFKLFKREFSMLYLFVINIIYINNMLNIPNK
jgi:hypothetical protein